MSGFDDNPFADNPFQDPSIQQATQKNPVNSATQNLEEYNPFDDSAGGKPITVPNSDASDPSVRGAANAPQYGGTGSTTPAMMSPGQEQPPPSYNKNANAQQGSTTPQISTAELQRRQEELERKARELERREAELQNAPYNARKNNWPPIPESFPIQPCFYQDINVDIPVEFQKIVRNLYYIWVLNAGVLLLNSVVFLIRLFAFGAFVEFFVSLVYLVVFIPASYLCWFRPAYKAFRSDSSFNFMVFFFIFLAQFITNVVFATKVSGACGIIDAIGVIKEGGGKSIGIGILILIVGIGFAKTAVFVFLMLIRVHRVYRSTGASFAKAQQEFASGVMRNEHVQGAATSIASDAIRNQFNNSNNSNAPRY